VNGVRIERVSSEGIAPEPISYGYTYDRAVVVHARRSRVLFISATAGMTVDGAPVDGGIEPQFDRALGIVRELVKRAAVGQSQVRRLVVWCDSNAPAGLSARFAERSRGAFPNAACAAMRGGIVRDGFLTEIEAIAEAER
jgi:enamine deaminase RidA (YjgF/YER057c/UK114 family)